MSSEIISHPVLYGDNACSPAYNVESPIVIFPEINFDKIDKVMGLDITICTSSKNNSQALELLKSFNMPFKLESTN